jgi:hypothetical protein
MIMIKEEVEVHAEEAKENQIQLLESLLGFGI